MPSNTIHSRRQMLRIFLAAGLVGAIWLFAVGADAHGVTVFAWVDGDTVHVESKFSGGRRPKGAPIEVYDGSGNRLLTGVTDQNGEFTFTVPQKTDLKIVLQAGMGHRAEWIIPAEELQGLEQSPDVPPKAAGNALAAPSAASQPETSAGSPSASRAPAGPTATEIEKAVEKALDRKLQPIIKRLNESRPSGPDLQDVLGGIGYIVGLVGLAAYLRSRRAGRSSDAPAAGGRPPVTGNPQPGKKEAV